MMGYNRGAQTSISVSMRSSPGIHTMDPFHCLPATYTENIVKDQEKGSQAYRAKIEADRKRLGLDG